MIQQSLVLNRDADLILPVTRARRPQTGLDRKAGHGSDRRGMAARQQRPAAASDGSAEVKRTDFRANEKKCCEFGFSCALKVKC